MSKVHPVTGLNDRVFIRKQGCWNCKHADYERARQWWQQKRQDDLQVALGITMESPFKEEDPKVLNIRRMVDLIDHGMAQGDLTKCFGPGLDANDNPIGDVVRASYLCRQWSAAQGASVAREGEAADPLPMELDDRADTDESWTSPILEK